MGRNIRNARWPAQEAIVEPLARVARLRAVAEGAEAHFCGKVRRSGKAHCVSELRVSVRCDGVRCMFEATGSGCIGRAAAVGTAISARDTGVPS